MKLLAIRVALVLTITGLAWGQTVLTTPNLSTAIRGAKTLQEMMRNPDSFKIQHVIFTADKNWQSYCYDYISQNGFGGMNRSFAKLIVTYKDGGSKTKLYTADDVSIYQRSKGSYANTKNLLDITEQFKQAQGETGKPPEKDGGANQF